MQTLLFTALGMLGLLAALPQCLAQAEDLQEAPLASAEVLRSVQEVRDLRYEEAKEGPPVVLEVTVISHLLSGFDGQDETGGLFFQVTAPPPVGTRILVSGNVTGGLYEPYIVVDTVEELGIGQHPQPQALIPDHLQSGFVDNRWVEATGLLMNLEMRGKQNRWAQAVLVTGFAELKVRFRNQNHPFLATDMNSLSGAQVRLGASGAPLFNDTKQRIGLELVCPGPEFVEILEPAPAFDDLPLTRLSEIRSWNYLQQQPGLVRTRGVVTLIDHEKEQLVIQDGDVAAPVSGFELDKVSIGSSVQAIGLPQSIGFFVGLRFASLSGNSSELPSPEAVRDTSPVSRENPYRLVRIVGKVAEKTGRFVSLQTDANTFVPVHGPAQVIQDFPNPGAQVEITGVKWIEAEPNGDVRSVAIEIRSSQDLKVLALPPWWTPARYLTAITLLCLSVIAALAWSTLLRRQVQRQTLEIQDQIQANATLEERTRIARELHDTLSQGFAGVAYQLTSVRNHLKSAPDIASNKLNLAIRMVEHSLAEARRSLQDLRSPLLQQHSLSEALRYLVEEVSGTSDLHLEVQVAEVTFNIPKAAQHEILRIAQEALTNAMRHAAPSTIWVQLKEDGTGIEMLVRDDGKGFDPMKWTKNPDHFGLRGMHERASRMGALLLIHSALNEGTTITLHYPR